VQETNMENAVSVKVGSILRISILQFQKKV